MWCLVRLPFLLWVMAYVLRVMAYALLVIGYLLCITHNAPVPYRWHAFQEDGVARSA